MKQKENFQCYRHHLVNFLSQVGYAKRTAAQGGMCECGVIWWVFLEDCLNSSVALLECAQSDRYWYWYGQLP